MLRSVPRRPGERELLGDIKAAFEKLGVFGMSSGASRVPAHGLDTGSGGLPKFTILI